MEPFARRPKIPRSLPIVGSKPGDSFEKGETIVEVQTEKVSFEVPAPFSGVLSEIKTKRGETAKTGQVIAMATKK